jgi:hypothetical protein
MGRTLKMRSVVVAAAICAFPLACSSSSSPTAPVDSGLGASSSGSGGSHSTGTKGNSSNTGGNSSTNAPPVDAGEDAPAAMTDGGAGGACTQGTLYARLGGHAGISGAVGAVVTAELANADIASYFFYQGEDCTGGTCTPSAAQAAKAHAEGHPTAAQIQECFTDLVGSAAGGPEKYTTPTAPVTVDAGTAGGGAFTCRSIAEAHKALKIDGAVFGEFLMIAGGVLTSAKVCPKDIVTLAGALEGFATAVVTVPGDAAVGPFPGSVDAALQLDGTY